MPEVVKLSREFVSQVVEVVKRVLREERSQQPHTPRHGAPAIRRKQGILNTSLGGANNAVTFPETATARDLKRNPVTGNLELSGNTTTITHRFEHIAIGAETFIAYEYIDGEWSIYKADCAQMGLPI